MVKCNDGLHNIEVEGTYILSFANQQAVWNLKLDAPDGCLKLSPPCKYLFSASFPEISYISYLIHKRSLKEPFASNLSQFYGFIRRKHVEPGRYICTDIHRTLFAVFAEW